MRADDDDGSVLWAEIEEWLGRFFVLSEKVGRFRSVKTEKTEAETEHFSVGFSSKPTVSRQNQPYGQYFEGFGVHVLA